MIAVTRLNNKQVTINSLLIETVEETPDTIITLTTGKKIMVRESAAQVTGLVQDYIRTIGWFPAAVRNQDVEGSR